MNVAPPPRPARTTRPLRHLAGMLVVLLLTPVLLAACGGSSMAKPTAPAADAASGMVDDGLGGVMTAVDRSSWNMRPPYVSAASQNTQAAYAFAIERPDILQWMPCYCGCSSMGHGSNVDCFVQRHDTGGVTFEEHASYCDVCVKTALMAKAMYGGGSSLLQIRQAVDRTFGGTGAPGTDTPLPPA